MIANYMNKKTIIDVNALEDKFGKLSKGILLLVESYNRSIKLGIDNAVNDYTNLIIKERDSVKNELLGLKVELEELRSAYAVQSNEIKALKEENAGYREREETIKRVLERK